MRWLERVRRYPMAVLAAVALAFVSWVWWDSLPGNQGMTEPEILDFEGVQIIAPPLVKVFPKLKPGMTRAEVESLVGAPGDIHPATVDGDRVTYYTDYEADFGAPRTVRPIRPMPKPSPERRAVVSLEFDATRPGHPLLNVHYPDPLF